MGDRVLIGVAVAIFVGTLLVMTLVWGGIAHRVQLRRRHLAHRFGADGAAEPRLERPGTVPGPLGIVGGWQEQAGEPPDAAGLLARSAGWAVLGVALSVWWLEGGKQGLGLLLGLIPWVQLRVAMAHRSTRLTEQLPDAIDRMGRTLRAGHAFADALRLSAAELPDPIGQELARVSEAHRLGVDLRACLEHFADRAPENFDVRLFVSVVLLHRETGGNPLETLDHLAETIRERLVFREKVRALTAETNASAAILASLPFVVAAALLVVRPEYLAPLLTTGMGRTLLAYAILSLVAGALAMRGFARVEV